MSILLDFIKEKAKKKKESPKNRIESMAEEAAHCVFCTHIGKFTDPKVSFGVDAYVGYNPTDDGYIYTENVKHIADISADNLTKSGVSTIAVGGLLMLELEDGRTFLEHIEANDEDVIRDIESIGVDYNTIRANILKAKQSSNNGDTDNNLRQVFFPTDGGYRLLSVLAPVSIMTEVSAAIKKADDAYFASRSKADKENYLKPHKEIYGSTMISIGGDNAQNVSVLNIKHTIKRRTPWLMLNAQPPQIKKRDFVYPTTDFFKNSLYRKRFQKLFKKAHYLYTDWHSNMEIREKIADAELDIADEVLFIATKAQELPAGWTQTTKLPECQRIWLDKALIEKQNEDKEWKQEIALAFGRWYIATYKELLGKEAVEMGDTELDVIQKRFMSVLKEG